jgi:general stress protein 26
MQGNGAGFAKLSAMIEAIDFGMLTTEDKEGHLRSRPMSTQAAKDGTLYFFTDHDAPKVAEIAEDARVNVSYADPSTQTYVSVSGRASVSKDTAKIREVWNEDARKWFPGGPDDGKIGLIKVKIEEAEYWDVNTKAMQSIGGSKDAATTQMMTDHKKLSA